MYLSEFFCLQIWKPNLHWLKSPKKVSPHMEMKILRLKLALGIAKSTDSLMSPDPVSGSSHPIVLVHLYTRQIFFKRWPLGKSALSLPWASWISRKLLHLSPVHSSMKVSQSLFGFAWVRYPFPYQSRWLGGLGFTDQRLSHVPNPELAQEKNQAHTLPHGLKMGG